ncbi:MAG: hypothetical protein KC435_13740 [Thermomicrobiales bacterium]|nr:hypothetical protein [Thermomicrobiales bacterium]
MRTSANHRTTDESTRSPLPESTWLNRQPSSAVFNTPAPEVARQIDDIAQLLQDVDTRSADRLDELANAVSNANGRQRWSDVDLRRAFNTDRLAHAYAVKHEGGYAPKAVEIADKLRNVLVLVPILLTWWALGAAVSNWAAFEEANPDSGMSFLVAWEQGFGGLSRWWEPSLSHVAFVDAVLILAIIILTFYAHGRAEAQEDKIADTASLFQAEMDNALAEASVLLATDRSSRPVRLADAVERMADSFEESSAAMLNQLQVEHDRMELMATRREREVNDFGTFATGMRAGAEEMQRVLGSLRDVAKGLEASINDMTGDTAKSAEQQRALLLAVNNLERLTSSAIQNDQSATRQLSATAARLGETAEKTISGAESASAAGRLAMEAVANIAEIAKEITASQNRIDSVLTAQNTASARLSETLGSTEGQSSQTARQLGEIGNGLAAIQRDFATVGQQNAQQIKALAKVVEGQTTSSQDLTNLAREISGVAMSTAQRQREVNDQLQHLVQRLDSVANSLNHLIAQQPGSIHGERVDIVDADTPSTTPATARWSRSRT